MTSRESATDPDAGGDDAPGDQGVADSDSPPSLPAGLGDGLERLRPPGPSPEARQRLEARFARFVDSGGPGPLARVGAWFGFGTAGPRLSPRFAAGALLILAAGGTTSTLTGLTPLELATRAGELAQSIMANLDPRSGEDVAVVPEEDPTILPTPSPTSPPPAPSPTGTSVPTATIEPEAAGADETRTAAAVTPTPAPTRQTRPPVATTSPARTATATAVAGLPATTPPPPTATVTSPPETPAPTETPETPEPTSVPRATPTPTFEPTVAPATLTPTSTPVPTNTPEPTPTATRTSTPTPPTATATPDPWPEVGVYEAGEAGTVTLRRDGTQLTVIVVSPSPGWTYLIEGESGSEVAVSFRSVNRELYFRAQVSNDAVEVTIEED